MRINIQVLLGIGLFMPMLAWANYTIEIRQGTQSAIPVAVVPFEADETHTGVAQELAQLIGSDLNVSTRLSTLPLSHEVSQTWRAPIQVPAWRDLGAHYMVMGSIQPNPTQADQWLCFYRLVDLYQTPQTAAQVKDGTLQTSTQTDNIIFERKVALSDPKKVPQLAHYLSDQFYEGITGTPGIFSTRVAYTRLLRTPQGRRYSIEIMDFQGSQIQSVVESSEPLMSPSWSPDGRSLAYVSFAQKRAGIYVLDLASGKTRRLTHFPGINGAPAFSPDGKQMAFVLSKSGAPKLYVMNLETHNLTQLTEGTYIDTEPSWAPDGASLIFT
ncbi:MAG: hypothetical protein V4490_00380 [Pseudomonadota bacterium]